jgi:hypothetical protein
VLTYSFFFLPIEVRAANVPLVMVCIAHYESNMHQFAADGSPLESPTHDYGIFQINQGWLPTAKAMGLDVLHSEEDNITFAMWLADHYGLKSWSTYTRCRALSDT